MLILLMNLKSNAQTCILNMSDQFGSATCNLHCWARATKNVLYYFSYTNLLNVAIIDYARREGFFLNYEGCTDNSCAICYLTPDSCCRALDLDGIDDILYYFGTISSTCNMMTIDKSSQYLYEQFILGKPVIIRATGHVFVAYGISGVSVSVIDGDDEVTRHINNIAPGRTWVGTFVMNNNDNCSYTNNISNNLYYGRTYIASNTLTLSNSVIYHSGYTTTLKAGNKVQLCEGVEIRKNSALLIQTNYNYCQ